MIVCKDEIIGMYQLINGIFQLIQPNVTIPTKGKIYGLLY